MLRSSTTPRLMPAIDLISTHMELPAHSSKFTRHHRIRFPNRIGLPALDNTEGSSFQCHSNKSVHQSHKRQGYFVWSLKNIIWGVCRRQMPICYEVPKNRRNTELRLELSATTFCILQLTIMLISGRYAYNPYMDENFEGTRRGKGSPWVSEGYCSPSGSTRPSAARCRTRSFYRAAKYLPK